jgi:hypothetical protein
MRVRRAITRLIGPGATGATTTISLGVPSWADTVLLHIKATTAGASTYDASLVIDSGDGEGTAIAVAAADQIAASGTDVQRYLAVGPLVSLAGTGVDGVAFPLSSRMALTLTAAGTVTDVDVEAEFFGYVG